MYEKLLSQYQDYKDYIIDAPSFIESLFKDGKKLFLKERRVLC